MSEMFYKKLNESASDNRWEEWKSYRYRLMEFVSKAMWSNSTCIILGAGNMHDIDLAALPAKEATLADIDTDSVRRGVEFQNQQDKAEIIRMDIGGLDSADIFRKIKEKPEDLANILESHVLDTSLESINYDNVMISAIYTQLFIPQFLTILRANILEENALETALSFTARLISHLNDTVINLAADDATICAWSDIFEYSTSDPALTDIKKHIDDKNWMDKFYESYIRDYGHGLGSFGIEDLAGRLKDIEYSWLVWPFSNERIMIVKIICGIVTS